MEKTLAISAAANYFLFLADYSERKLTNKKLQKLLYYAQAWTLALKNAPLFKEPVEAWIHGPAIPAIYRRYKKYGFGPIPEKGSDKIPSEHKQMLDEIWMIYGKYDAEYLELLTHSEEPWIRARHGLDVDESSNVLISHESMQEFYASLWRKVEAKNAASE